MADYKTAGVDIIAGDAASKIAYKFARSTFSSRRGLIGEPVTDEGSFAGMLDMGDFYLVQGDDGVGTKIEIAESIGKYDTLGYDLLAMVCDDAICLGAETISISNTIDTNKVDPEVISQLMQGLAQACLQQKVVIPGGEIAEVGSSVNGNIWNATAVGVVKKDQVISGRDIQVGDKIIALQESGFRSNGFTLVRYILENKFGKDVYGMTSPWGQSWGEAVLQPSTIYSAAILQLIGRFSEEAKFKIKGIAHITGGGIAGNFNRILKQSKLGARFTDLFQPSALVKEIQRLGNVKEQEAYKTWNMGNGMMLVVAAEEAEEIVKELSLASKIVGEIVAEPEILIQTCGIDPQEIVFSI
jgi:phosphoribosylformylglycinamidine cyclo-ligase